MIDAVKRYDTCQERGAKYGHPCTGPDVPDDCPFLEDCCGRQEMAHAAITQLKAMPDCQTKRPAMSEATCETCPWWDETHPGVGRCRFSAPYPNRSTCAGLYVFPATGRDDWCGEHPDRKTQVPPLHGNEVPHD